MCTLCAPLHTFAKRIPGVPCRFHPFKVSCLHPHLQLKKCFAYLSPVPLHTMMRVLNLGMHTCSHSLIIFSAMKVSQNASSWKKPLIKQGHLQVAQDHIQITFECF